MGLLFFIGAANAITNEAKLHISQVDGLQEQQDAQNASFEYGGFDISFNNGTNALVAGEFVYGKAKYNGVITELSALSVQTGSINITLTNKTLGTYICSVVITDGTDATTSCTPYSFNRGDWLNATIISVTNIKQVTAAVQTRRS